MTTIEIPASREPGRFERGLGALLGAPPRVSEPSLTRLILWVPVAFGFGAALYFLPASEPARWLGTPLAIIACALVALGFAVRSRPWLVYALVLTGFLIGGFALAQWRTWQAHPPPIEISDRAVSVEGWIEAVERGGTRPRLRIRVAEMSGIEDPPKRIRVRVGLNGFQPGDSVRLRAVLSPPSGPAAPGGYDPARAAWFDQVALIGFAISRLEPANATDEASAQRSLARFRWSLAERIRERMGPETGGVGAALLTGDRSGVAPEDAEALRVSGLGHILAISGLHMALFAGGIYYFARLGLASIDRFSRAHDPRKLAAFIALIAATGYLVLSGGAIPTQRAWVMAVVVLLGVMLDRKAFSMRSLAIAAMVVIALAPESVVEAGFQMSFAAVAALIAVYEVWGRIRPVRDQSAGLFSKITDAIGGLSTTSLVAGGATGAFAAFHFQRLAAYGLVANLAAMPIFTFWVMPAGVVALALMPVGLDGPALAVMDFGLRIVLAIAHWTESQSGSGVSVLAANGVVIGLYSAGFAAVTLGLGLVRLAGLGTGCAALVLWLAQSPADLMVTDDGVLIARFGEEDAYQASSLRSSRFDTGVFLQRAGQGGTRPDGAPLRCDDFGCLAQTRDNITIALTATPEALAEDCEHADIVIFDGQASDWRRRRCRALLLDAAELATHGGLEFVTRDGVPVVSGTAQDGRRNRLWSRNALTAGQP